MLASQYPAAALAYVYAHRIDPANYAVSTKLGDALLAAGDLKAALDNFETALALDANFAPALQAPGVAPVRQRRWTDALSLLRQAVAQDPSLWKAHSALGIAADMLHDHVLAATHHARAIALHPEELELIATSDIASVSPAGSTTQPRNCGQPSSSTAKAQNALGGISQWCE